MQQRIADIVLEIRRSCAWRRTWVDRNTYLNEAFDKDAQYVEWDPARLAVVQIPAPRNAIRRTLNLMKPYNRAQESRLTRGRPTYQVVGTGSDPQAEDAAELANDLIPWIEHHVKIEQVRDRVAFWLQRAGTCVVFNPWDFDGGAVGEVMGRAVRSGAPFSDVHPPHEVFFYPVTAVDVKTASGIGRDVRMGRADAVMAFPKLRNALLTAQEATAGLSSSRDYTRAIRDMQPGRSGWLAGEGSNPTSRLPADEDDEVVLVEFFLQAGAALMDVGANEVFLFPNGLRLVMSPDGTIGHFDDNQYVRLPATRIGYSASAGFWSPAPCTPLRPIQMAINWAYSLWEEHMLLAGRPVMLWPRSARGAWRRLQDLTTRILRFSAGAKGEKPEYLDPPNFPTRLPELLNFLIQMWQDISGLHEVSRGQLPAAGISGVAIQLLQDQDDSQIGFVTKQLEDGLGDIMEQHLENIRRFVQYPTLSEIAGSAYQARVFQGQDLGEGVHVRVTRGSALPKSPAALEAKARDAWVSGYLVDEFGLPDWRRLLTLQGLGNEDLLYDEQQQDMNNAETVIEQILGLDPDSVMLALTFFKVVGTLPQELMPRLYDDHIVHEQRFRRRLKQLQEDQLRGQTTVNPVNLELLEARWQIQMQLAVQQRMGLGPMAGFGTGASQPGSAGGGPAQGGGPAVKSEPAAPAGAPSGGSDGG